MNFPPNPYEGAILGWEDGELAWLGGSVPLPAGTYGPYTYIAGNEQLNIPQDASSLVNGQQLYMSNEKGEPVNVEYRTDTIASVSEVDAVASFYLMNSIPANLADLLANGTPYTQGAGVVTNQYLIRHNNNGSIDNGTNVFSSGGSAGFVQFSSLGEGPYAADGTLIPSSDGSFSGSEWTTFVYDDAIPTTDTYYQIFTSPVVSYQVFKFTGAGTGPTIALIDNKVLTFPTDNNFDKFEIGDVIQTESGAVSITAIDDTVPSITVDGGSFSGSDGSGSGGDTYLETKWSGAGSVFVGLDGAIVLRNNNEQWVERFLCDCTGPARSQRERSPPTHESYVRSETHCDLRSYAVYIWTRLGPLIQASTPTESYDDLCNEACLTGSRTCVYNRVAAVQT